MKCKSFFGFFELLSLSGNEPCPDCGGVVMSHVDPRTLADWHQQLEELAKSKGFEWLIGDAESYCDYYNDGAEPEEVLDEEIEAARSDC